MKFKELLNLKTADLNQELTKLRHEMESLRIKIRMGEVKNYKSLSGLKKDIARIQTLLATREFEE